MAIRTTMVSLIKKMQHFIGDDETNPIFSLETLQDFLDDRRRVVRYAPMRPEGTPTPFTGVIAYLDYYATEGFWEEDAQIFGPAWNLLTTLTADYFTGHWTFATSQVPTCYVVGKMYDMNGSAADALEAWAARLTGEYDFKSHGTQFLRSQQVTKKLEMAQKYRERQWLQVATLVRNDTPLNGRYD